MAGFCECGNEPTGYGTTELVVNCTGLTVHSGSFCGAGILMHLIFIKHVIVGIKKDYSEYPFWVGTSGVKHLKRH